MEISPAILALITTGSALLGVIVTSYFNLRTTRVTTESEERKHQREIVINAAIVNWKQQLELAKAGSNVQVIRPLDDYIIHMVAFSEMLLEKPINKNVVTERLNEFQEFVDAIDSFRKAKISEMSKPRDS
jgi:hypothetical protein